MSDEDRELSFQGTTTFAETESASVDEAALRDQRSRILERIETLFTEAWARLDDVFTSQDTISSLAHSYASRFQSVVDASGELYLLDLEMTAAGITRQRGLGEDGPLGGSPSWELKVGALRGRWQRDLTELVVREHHSHNNASNETPPVLPLTAASL